MMNDIKLIICDIDGTLLNSRRQISECTKAIIKRCQDNGYLFGLASGRPLFGIERRLNEWGIDFDVIVAMNGCELYDCRTGLKEDYYKLEPPIIGDIIKLYEPLNLNPLIYDEFYLHCAKSDESTHRITKNNGIKEDVGDVFAKVEKPQGKVVFAFDPIHMEKVEAFYKQHPSTIYRGFKSQKDLFEICDIRISKAYAIEKYARKYGFSLQNVLAFGDTSNDLEMIEAARIGVCMSNGSADLKAQADYITESNDDDGIAVFLKKYLFND